MKGWQYTAASCTGASHLKLGEDCQDAFALHVGLEQAVFLAADGAGSTRFGGQGAQLICEILRESLKEALPNFGKLDLERILLEARKALSEAADSANVSIKEYASTILGMLMFPTHVIGFQIGDGAIVYATRGEDQFHLFTKPDQGNYPNETFFLTSDNWLAHLQFKSLDENVDRLALFTDGIQDLGIKNGDPPMPHQDFFSPFFQVLRLKDGCEERQKMVESFLHSERVCQRTGDDKTLILVYRKGEHD